MLGAHNRHIGKVVFVMGSLGMSDPAVLFVRKLPSHHIPV